MNGDAADVVPDGLDFAGVYASPDPESERLEEIADRSHALNGARRPVESRHQPVASELHQATPSAIDLLPGNRLVDLQEAPPSSVTQVGSHLSGPNDVGERHRH